mmetsp:Transcript_15682/g.24056  ORF Transcript_15682/g.24056 Transcript_15682/m.24056 type:complete len:107 (+) Transcript_15682:793-1113(+)
MDYAPVRQSNVSKVLKSSQMQSMAFDDKQSQHSSQMSARSSVYSLTGHHDRKQKRNKKKVAAASSALSGIVVKKEQSPIREEEHESEKNEETPTVEVQSQVKVIQH